MDSLMWKRIKNSKEKPIVEKTLEPQDLIQFRSKNNFTTKDIAVLCSVRESTITKIEGGAKVPEATIKKVATALGLWVTPEIEIPGLTQVGVEEPKIEVVSEPVLPALVVTTISVLKNMRDNYDLLMILSSINIDGPEHRWCSESEMSWGEGVRWIFANRSLYVTLIRDAIEGHAEAIAEILITHQKVTDPRLGWISGSMLNNEDYYNEFIENFLLSSKW